MKRAVLTAAVLTLLSPLAHAGVWETQCAGCHNGSLAPSKAQLKAKFKTAKDFVSAAKKSNNPMMATVKNTKAINEAAKEIFKK